MTTLPRLVFAHANGFTGASYRGFLTPLAAHFDVHALDRLGHDPAYPVSNNWPALRDELVSRVSPMKRPIIGVGHSMGGVLMLMAAQHSPALFRCVVMLDPPLLAGRDAWTLRIAKRLGLADRVTPAGRSRGRRRVWPSRQAMSHYLRQRGLFKDFTEAALEDYVTGATRQRDDGSVELVFDPAMEVAIFRHLPDHLHGAARRMPVPVAMIAGEASDLMTAARCRRLARQGLRIESTPGGHMFPMEHPCQARETLLATIGSLLEIEHS